MSPALGDGFFTTKHHLGNPCTTLTAISELLHSVLIANESFIYLIRLYTPYGPVAYLSHTFYYEILPEPKIFSTKYNVIIIGEENDHYSQSQNREKCWLHLKSGQRAKENCKMLWHKWLLVWQQLRVRISFLGSCLKM